jgi:hypothetical protein
MEAFSSMTHVSMPICASRGYQIKERSGQNGLQYAEQTFVEKKPFAQREIPIKLDCFHVGQVKNCYDGFMLANSVKAINAINSADTMLDFHRISEEIVVDERSDILEMKDFIRHIVTDEKVKNDRTYNNLYISLF